MVMMKLYNSFNINDEIYALADSKKSVYGSGGMVTKLDAAKICMNAGCNMFIANGKKKNPIKRMINTGLDTRFNPKISTIFLI